MDTVEPCQSNILCIIYKYGIFIYVPSHSSIIGWSHPRRLLFFSCASKLWDVFFSPSLYPDVSSTVPQRKLSIFVYVFNCIYIYIHIWPKHHHSWNSMKSSYVPSSKIPILVKLSPKRQVSPDEVADSAATSLLQQERSKIKVRKAGRREKRHEKIMDFCSDPPVNIQKAVKHDPFLVGGLVAMNFIFPYIGNFIIPIDVHIFRRGWKHQPAFIVDLPMEKSGDVINRYVNVYQRLWPWLLVALVLSLGDEGHHCFSLSHRQVEVG